MTESVNPQNTPIEPPLEPPYDPEIDGPEQSGSLDSQPAVDGQQAAAGQEMLGATGDAQDGNLEKDPSEWVSGDQPATEAQKSYIDTLAKQAGEQIPADLTKAEASQHIDRLKKITGN